MRAPKSNVSDVDCRFFTADKHGYCMKAERLCFFTPLGRRECCEDYQRTEARRAKVKAKVAFWWGLYNTTGRLYDAKPGRGSFLYSERRSIAIIPLAEYRRLKAAEKIWEEWKPYIEKAELGARKGKG